jgi:hypothetical protein
MKKLRSMNVEKLPPKALSDKESIVNRSTRSRAVQRIGAQLRPPVYYLVSTGGRPGVNH